MEGAKPSIGAFERGLHKRHQKMDSRRRQELGQRYLDQHGLDDEGNKVETEVQVVENRPESTQPKEKTDQKGVFKRPGKKAA